jgi:hypothetical protein
MRFSANLLFLALLLPAGITQAQSPSQAPVQLPSGSAHFVIYQGDKSVGSADRTIQATPAGYAITSQGKMSLSKFNYSFTNTQHLDHALNLVSDQINGTVNGQTVTFTAHADSTGRQFQIDINAQGKQTQNTVDRHQHLVLLADLDPAAYTLLTHVGLDNPPTSWILIPKEQGFLVPSTYARDPSLRGRLNDTQVDVQHLTVTVGESNPISVELFYGRDGDILEADLPEQNFFVVRDGFKLIDRPKPTLPHGTAPPPPNGQQPQNGQPQNEQPPTGQPPQNGAPQYPEPQGGVPQMQQQ